MSKYVIESQPVPSQRKGTLAESLDLPEDMIIRSENEFQRMNFITQLLQPGGTVYFSGSFKPYLEEFLRKLADAPHGMSIEVASGETITTWTKHLLARLDIGEISLRELARAASSVLGELPWKALVVSGRNMTLDRPDFLNVLQYCGKRNPGLLIQCEPIGNNQFILENVSPVMRTALSESFNWPGILFWTTSDESVFLPFGVTQIEDITHRASEIFAHLGDLPHVALEKLEQWWRQEHPNAWTSRRSNIHFIHVSDVHFGSREAKRRSGHLERLVDTLVSELEKSGKIIPVITGDLMQSPSDDNAALVATFIANLKDACGERPIVVVGNHDVRRGGVLSNSYREATRFRIEPHVEWYDDSNVGIICMNSVMGGEMAQGLIGEEQLFQLGEELDEKQDWREYCLFAVLHHHPMPVETPEWYKRPFYEWMLGQFFEKTDSLKDEELVNAFFKARSIRAVLHGHKHIPRVDPLSETAVVVGCGSSVGKVRTVDGSLYMSVNIISVNTSSRQVIVRLLAERAPGGGLSQQKRHELVYMACQGDTLPGRTGTKH